MGAVLLYTGDIFEAVLFYTGDGGRYWTLILVIRRSNLELPLPSYSILLSHLLQ